MRTLGTNFNEILIEIQLFHWWKFVWKCHLQNGNHFVLVSRCCYNTFHEFNALVLGRRNSIANALELCLSCINPSNYTHSPFVVLCRDLAPVDFTHTVKSINKCTSTEKQNYWSLRCSWSIACRRCSNYIFIMDFTPAFNGSGKDNCKTRCETFKFYDFVHFILDIWW